MTTPAPSLNLGFDFVPLAAESTTPSEPKPSTPSRTVSTQTRLLEELGMAVVAQDCDMVKELLAKGAKPIGQTQGMRVCALVVQHFHSDIANCLLSAGMPLVYPEKLCNQAIEANNPDALRWVLHNKGYTSSHRALRLLNQAITRERDKIVAFFIDEKEGLSFDMDMVGVWDASKLIKMLFAKQQWDTLEKAVARFSVFKNALAQSKTHQHQSIAPFRYWLISYVHTFTYDDCCKLQELIARKGLVAAHWQHSFPLYVTKGSQDTWAKNFLDALVCSGAPALEKMVATPQGTKALVEQFTTHPGHFQNFYTHAARNTSQAVLKKLLPHVQNWTTVEGNNVAHLLLSADQNKSTFDDMYSLCPQWLLEENKHGQTPLANLEEDVRSYAEDRLLRRTLNDAKVGLRHNRTKKQARRM